MSHFTVLIATEATELEDVESAVEKALAPYDENTQVDPYWTKEADDLASWWTRTYYIEHATGDDKLKADATFEETMAHLERIGAHEGDKYRLAEDGSIERETTYNPQSKWDWWVIGGRWTGSLRLKPGAKGDTGRPGVYGLQEPLGPNQADCARKGDIDLEGLRAEAVARANARWDQVEEIYAAHPKPKPFRELVDASGYADFADKNDPEAKECIARVRKEYAEQPAIVAAKAAGMLADYFDSFEESYGDFTDREEFVTYHRNSVLCGFAFLGGEVGWMAPGEMGWFGSSSDDHASRLAYRAKVAEFIDLMDDDQILVMVDCHI